MHDKMPDSPSILTRKEEHLSLALDDTARTRAATHGLECFDFVHCALPESRLEKVDLSANLLGKALKAPLLIGSMTGGPTAADRINRHLAEAAQELGIAMGVGSQRVALEESGDNGLNSDLRRAAPDIVLLGNLGATQLSGPGGIDLARRAVEAIAADGLFIHLNPLQEALQPHGDTDWTGVLGAISELCSVGGFPVLAKEIGCGISAEIASQLVDAGVAGIDVAGAGGTSWAWIEGQRHDPEEAKFLSRTFDGWGVPTAEAIRQCRLACPKALLIGSGGIRNGVEAAKAIHLGADLVSIAGGVLPAALKSTDAVISYFSSVIQQLRITCFVSGAGSYKNLPDAAVRSRS